jgi:glycosyltransferase involved in cell wall biosynthesis
MRVAFVDQTGSKPGGAEESLTLLLRNLPSDIEASVILFEDGEFAQRMRDAGYPTKIFPVAPGLRKITREEPSSRAALALPGAIFRLAQLLGEQRVELVHTNSMKAHFLAAPAARLRGIRSVMHLRDMVDGIGRSALRAVARSCSQERIAISQALSRWYGMPHTTVVANPVDLSEYHDLPGREQARRQLGIPVDDCPVIGIVGRINRWKGHDRFLRIAANVNAEVPIRCAIVGEARFRDADFVPELHRLASTLGIAGRTTFVPWQDDPRLAYCALDILCNCSEREPFGRTIVEAAAAGVPTVAFADGGAADIIRDSVDGRLIAAGDEEGFTSALLGLLRAPEKYGAAGNAARQGSIRFSAKTHADRVARILRSASAV